MSAGADSIRPVALDFTPEVEAAARALAGLRDSFLPPRAPAAARPSRGPKSARAQVARPAAAPTAPILTAVAFRPDGRKALAIELTPVRLVALSVGTLATLSTAVALGWMIGEWTARL